MAYVRVFVNSDIGGTSFSRIYFSEFCEPLFFQICTYCFRGNFWNVGIKGTNFFIRLLNAEISIGACGVLLGIFGGLLMLFAFRNIKKITRASF